jgi:hypothetical protein
MWARSRCPDGLIEIEASSARACSITANNAVQIVSADHRQCAVDGVGD